MNRPIGWRVMALIIGLIPLGNRVMAAGAFDATYTGPQHETKSNNSGSCRMLERPSVAVVVKDNVLKYRWGVPIEATVQPDGSFSDVRPGMAFRGAPSVVSTKGKIVGGNLEADIGTDRCAAHLSLKKK